MDIYKNRTTNRYFSFWVHSIKDCNNIEDAQKFSSKECILTTNYIRISYEEEIWYIIKL